MRVTQNMVQSSMTPSDLTADLPAPRDDEPASLRQDIADELADHLACAVRREELRENSEPWGSAPRNEVDSSCGRSPDRATGTNDGTAEPRRLPTYQRVLARFGDPRAIARKLWWDAMRENIMGQRILTAMAALAVMAGCALIGWMCQMLMQMQSVQRDMLRESQAQNVKLLEQFQALVGELKTSAETDAPPEWVPLTVKCTFDTEDGPPAAGVKVDVRGDTERTLGIGDELTSDANGVVDFGKVLYARYDIACRMSNGMHLRESVSIRPGQPKVVKIICPSAPPPPVAVRFDIQPPEALRSKPLYYLAIIDSAWQDIGSRKWRWSSREMDLPSYVLGAEGSVLGEVDPESSRALRQLDSERGYQGSATNAEFLKLIRELKLSPMIDRNGFQLSGTIMALTADDDPTGGDASRADGPLPPLKPLRRLNPTEFLSMNGDTRAMRVHDEGAQFWKFIAEALEHGDAPRRSSRL
jgi:hypothetical protein